MWEPQKYPRNSTLTGCLQTELLGAIHYLLILFPPPNISISVWRHASSGTCTLQSSAVWKWTHEANFFYSTPVHWLSNSHSNIFHWSKSSSDIILVFIITQFPKMNNLIIIYLLNVSPREEQFTSWIRYTFNLAWLEFCAWIYKCEHVYGCTLTSISSIRLSNNNDILILSDEL